MFDDKLKKYVKDEAVKFIRNGFVDWKGYRIFLNTFLPEGEFVPVNKNTGEINRELEYRHPLVAAANQAFFGKLDQINGKGPDERGEYVQVFREFQVNLEGKLSNVQRARLLELMPLVNFNDKPISLNDKPMTAQEIADYWGISLENARNNFLGRYCKEEINVLYKKRKGNQWFYYFNQKCIFKGSLNGKRDEFVKVYQEKISEVIFEIKRIEENKLLETKKDVSKRNSKGQLKSKVEIEKEMKNKTERKTTALGILHAIIPYFHPETYYLVKEPTQKIVRSGEKTIEALLRDQKRAKRQHRHLPLAQLARIVSSKQMDKEKDSTMKTELIMEHLNTLQLAGALKFDKTKGKLTVRIHPYLMFSSIGDGTDEYTKYVVAEFGEHEVSGHE
ncbi:hypothetical protein [Lysinibacillus xylanilyticus]|uniref:Uncharacterized protein n=1 Tax=Lysinibacillus xylanilyticus TaxID=582475 RepID=A0ABV3W039_9BACI